MENTVRKIVTLIKNRFGNVENKSSATIRSELTKENVTKALGYTPSETDTTYSDFVKSGSGAKSGLVPAPPTTAGTTKYLREDGTWVVPPDTKTTVDASINSTSTNPVQNKVIYNAMIYKNNSYVQSLETGQAIEGYGSNPSEVLSGHDGTIRTIIEYLNRKAEVSTATASFDGLMSAADKSKLDSITSNTCQTGTCSIDASTSKKTVSITGFTLAVGARVVVNFTNGNTSSSATLNVTSTGAKAMYYFDGTRVYYLNAGVYYEFIYDGTYWRLLGIANPNMLTGSRSYERYGIKMNGSALEPLNSGYRPNLGSSSNKFDTAYINSIYSGSVLSDSVLRKVDGTYKELLPPYPLVKGYFSIVSEQPFYSIPADYIYAPASTLEFSNGNYNCALCSQSIYSEYYVILRIIGAELDMNTYNYKPFVAYVLCSNSSTGQWHKVGTNGSIQVNVNINYNSSCCSYDVSLGISSGDSNMRYYEIDVVQ